MNEAVRDQYFTLNVEILESLGAGAVTRLFPSSLVSVRRNREYLAKKFFDAYTGHGIKPLIIIGHSKGGLETLATLLAYPQFVEQGIVSQAILVQSPLMGNAFNDRQGLVGRTISNFLSVSPGHFSLGTAEINSMIEDRIDRLPRTTRSRLSRAVSYVVSSEAPERHSRALRLSNRALKIDIDFDGLVAKLDMWIPNFGTVIGDLKADHIEYVLGKELLLGERFDPEKIKAFTTSLVLNAFQNQNGDSREYKNLTERLKTYRKNNPLCERLIR
jgi:hypothetical protein